MYLIKKIYFRVFILLNIVILLGMGFYIYLNLTNMTPDSSIELKFVGEQSLFIAYIFVILFIGSYYYIVVRQEKDIYVELDKIKEYSEKGNINKNSVKKLGKLGEKIMLINAKLSELNEKRVKKITSLSKEINFLYNLIDIPIFSVNMKGEIDKVSKKLTYILDVDKQNIIDQPINIIIDEINFDSLAQELKQSKMVPIKSPLHPDLEKSSDLKYFAFYPIFNIKNELSSSVCILIDKEEYVQLQENKPEEEKKPGLSPLLDRLNGLHNI